MQDFNDATTVGGCSSFTWGGESDEWDAMDMLESAFGPSVTSSGFELSGMLLDHYSGKSATTAAPRAPFKLPKAEPSAEEHPPATLVTPSISSTWDPNSRAMSPVDDLPPPSLPSGGITLGYSGASFPMQQHRHHQFARASDFPKPSSSGDSGAPPQQQQRAPTSSPRRSANKRPGRWSALTEEEDSDNDELLADGGRKAVQEAEAVVKRAVGRRAAAVAAAAVAAVDADDEGDGDEEASAGEEDVHSDGERDLQQKRARNREHAKKSRMRKKVMLDGLEWELLKLRKDNLRLRHLIKSAMPDKAEVVLRACASSTDTTAGASTRGRTRHRAPSSAGAANDPATTAAAAAAAASPAAAAASGACHPGQVEATSSEADAFGTFWAGDGMGPIRAGVPSALHLMERGGSNIAEALGASQQTIILTNPRLPGNPIVYASPGFLELTGYSLQQVIGRDWTLLCGPATDSTSLAMLSRNLEAGRDTSLCLVSYKADGTAFWNQMFMGALRDRAGAVVNFVGVLCEVRQMPREEFRRRLHKVPLPDKLMTDYSEEAELSGRAAKRRASAAAAADAGREKAAGKRGGGAGGGGGGAGGGGGGAGGGGGSSVAGRRARAVVRPVR